MSRPVLWLLAGGNGAGKSTFYAQYLARSGITFINADEIARKAFHGEEEARSYDAAVLAAEARERLLSEGRSFCFETVFSHPSKIDFVARARAAGYHVNLVFIHLDNPDLNVARVESRVTDGGHSVPEAKVRGRLKRLVDNVRKAIPLCDRVMLFDNADFEAPYRKVAEKLEDGSWHLFGDGRLPPWAVRLIS